MNLSRRSLWVFVGCAALLIGAAGLGAVVSGRTEPEARAAAATAPAQPEDPAEVVERSELLFLDQLNRHDEVTKEYVEARFIESPAQMEQFFMCDAIALLHSKVSSRRVAALDFLLEHPEVSRHMAPGSGAFIAFFNVLQSYEDDQESVQRTNKLLMRLTGATPPEGADLRTFWFQWLQENCKRYYKFDS